MEAVAPLSPPLALSSSPSSSSSSSSPSSSPSSPSPLLAAVREKDLAQAWQHLNRGGDPNLCDASRSSLLHLACREGNVALVMLLFTKGALLSSRDKLGQTPLHVAASVGSYQIVAFLLKAGADTEAQDEQGQVAEEVAFHQNHMTVYHLLAGARKEGAPLTRKEEPREAKSSPKKVGVLEKGQKKLETKEGKLMEQELHLKTKLAELMSEKEGLEALPPAQLGKREKLQLQELDRKILKLDEKRHRNSAKIRALRSSSFDQQGDKGQAWLNYLKG